MARREYFILQFDIDDEPNNIALTSIKLEGRLLGITSSIHPTTASDVYEAITGKNLWNQEETENEQND